MIDKTLRRPKETRCKIFPSWFRLGRLNSDGSWLRISVVRCIAQSILRKARSFSSGDVWFQERDSQSETVANTPTSHLQRSCCMAVEKMTRLSAVIRSENPFIVTLSISSIVNYQSHTSSSILTFSTSIKYTVERIQQRMRGGGQVRDARKKLPQKKSRKFQIFKKNVKRKT